MLPRAIQAAAERQNDRRLGQRNLFDAFGDGRQPAAVGTRRRSSAGRAAVAEAEKLKYEKEVLDFYFSSHPLAKARRKSDATPRTAPKRPSKLPAGKEVTVGGMLTQLRYKNTKKARNGNSRYLLCMLEDFSGAVKCVMWPDDLMKFKDEVREDVALFVKGTLDRNQAEPTVVISRIFSLEQAQRELATGLHLLVKLDQHQPRDLDTIGYLLKKSPGNCPVMMTIRDAAKRDCVLRSGTRVQHPSRQVSP